MDTPESTPPPVQVVRHQYEYAAPQRTSGMAVTSLVLGILSVLGLAAFFLPPLLAVIFGHVAVGSCGKDPSLGGKGMAIAGLVMGWLGLAGWILIFLLFGGLAALLGMAGATGAMH